MRQFFMSIQRELEEASVLDGANTVDIISGALSCHSAARCWP